MAYNKSVLQNELTNLDGIYGNSNTSSPFKDRYSNNISPSKYSENYSSEKKSTTGLDQSKRTASQSRYYEDDSKLRMDKTNSYIAEKDDQRSLYLQKMSKEVRSDPDVSNKLGQLEKATKVYMTFDMQKFQGELNQDLENQIGKIRQEYSYHQSNLSQRVNDCQQLNKNSAQMKDESVNMRINKQKHLQEISQKSSQFDSKYEKDNQEKGHLREKLTDLEKTLRELQRQIVETNVENEGLRNILNCEKDLREERNVEEANALLMVNDDLKQTNLAAEEEKKKARKQREFVETSVGALEKSVQDQKQRVQELVQQIKQSKDHNQEQIQKLEGELRATLNENKALKNQRDKQESLTNQLEKEVQNLQSSEKAQNEQWERQIKDIEYTLTEKKSEIQDILQKTAETNQEINSLKVLSMTSSFKFEYEIALKEMYETHQFETRLRRLGGDIENSQAKASILQEEISKIQESWAEYYEQTLEELKERLSQLSSTVILQKIEEIVEVLKDKDSTLRDLESGINELKSDVGQNKNSNGDLDRAKAECQNKIKEYRRVLNEKTVLYDEMLARAKQLMNRDDLIIKNEEEIIRLKYEIDLSKLEMEQKKELMRELEMKLDEDKTRYKELKLELQKSSKKQDALFVVLKQKQDEVEQLEEMLKDRDNMIDDLQRQLDYKPPEKPKPEPKKELYKAIKGDLIDELFARCMNQLQCRVPIKRMGEGNYMFGTKKIHAKILNGRVVLKVGGGYMVVDEFVRTYGEAEFIKVSGLVEKGLFDLTDYYNTGAFIGYLPEPSTSSPTKKRMGSGSPKR